MGAGLVLGLAFLAAGTVGCGSKGSGGAGGAAGSGVCSMGSEGCACYGNNTCNAPLSCLSKICVNATGNGGAPGAGGSPATGGSPGSGGSPAGGAPGSGGDTSSGGTTGSGGTPSTGGATGSGGAPSTGGATGSGGTPSTGGTTGTGGAAGAAGAPTGPLQFTGGWVDGTSNAYGIQGALYTFDDGAGSTISPDCTSSGSTCFGGTTTPTTKFCVSGSDTEVLYSVGLGDYDYSTYWGAAVGFDLNGSSTPGGTHAPYVASAHNVKGFSMYLTNNLTSAIRFSYIVYNGSTNNTYCVSQLTPGQNTIYFTNATANCYQTGGTTLSNVAADGTVALQWQVASNSISSATAFNYCVDNLTPITQ